MQGLWQETINIYRTSVIFKSIYIYIYIIVSGVLYILYLIDFLEDILIYEIICVKLSFALFRHGKLRVSLLLDKTTSTIIIRVSNNV